MASVETDNGSEIFQTRNVLVKRLRVLNEFSEQNEGKLASYSKLKPEEKQKLLLDFKMASGITGNAKLVVNIEKGEDRNYLISASLVDSAGNQLSTVALDGDNSVYAPEAIKLNSSVEQAFRSKIARFMTENLDDIIKAKEKSSILGLGLPGIDNLRRASLGNKLKEIFGDGRIENLLTTTDGRIGITGVVWNKNNTINGPDGKFEVYIDSKGKVTSVLQPPYVRNVDSALQLKDLPASFRKGNSIFTVSTKIDLNGDGLLTRDEIIKSDKPKFIGHSSLKDEVAERNMANFRKIFISLPPAAQSKVISNNESFEFKPDLKILPDSSVEPLVRQLISDERLDILKKLLASRTEAEEVRLLKLFAKDIVALERIGRSFGNP